MKLIKTVIEILFKIARFTLIFAWTYAFFCVSYGVAFWANHWLRQMIGLGG